MTSSSAERYPHLPLLKTDVLDERRRRGGGRPPQRDFAVHGGRLANSVDGLLRRFALPKLPAQIDPALIFKVHLDANVDDEDWRKSDLSVISHDSNKTVILFSSDAELTGFRKRLAAYQAGPGPDRKGAPYGGLFASISEEGLVPLGPGDRIGALLKDKGLESEKTYNLDLELWPILGAGEGQRRLSQVEEFIRARGGGVLDRIVNESMVIARIRVSGGLAQELLDLPVVARLDLPSRTDLTVADVIGRTMENLEIVASDSNNPSICIIDSGITRGHPLLGPAIGDADVFPASIGSADDDHGHGTKVAGIALYGEVEQCIAACSFAPELIVYSARVTNKDNQFDDSTLVLNQMRAAITRFADEGCRVFNISLGDSQRVYDGGRLLPWAAMLDSIARERDVLIVVSSGNRPAIPDEPRGTARSTYPDYLLDEEARVIDPATAALALTVGSLSSEGQPYAAQRNRNDPAYQRISKPGQPSVFTRSGPGQQGSIKPEFCDFGGDYSYDGRLLRIAEGDPGLSAISMHNHPLDHLFAFGSGSSFAAPRVAHKAARLWGQLPEVSPDRIRVLLALGADVPQAAAKLFGTRGDCLRVCGYGQPDLERSSFSAKNRVILTAEGELPLDSFHIFEVPISDDFSETRGARTISAALAFYPPVRHTRIDYLGARMSFRLIRGKTLEDVATAFRRHGKNEGDPPDLPSGKYELDLRPGKQPRDASTLQKGTIVLERNPRAEYGDTYYLVVRAERRWAPEEVSYQRYAVGVLLEHSQPIDLYAAIQLRVRVPVRARVTP